MKIATWLLASTILGSACSSQAVAADLPTRKSAPAPLFTQLPAVDGVNGKLEAFGLGTELPTDNLPAWAPTINGWTPKPRRWRAGAGGAGAVSVPLGTRFGAQLETMAAVWNGRPVVGAGAHLFWRDPNVGLLGVYGSGSYFGALNGIGVARAAVEGEAYLGRFTLEGMAGVEGGKRRYESFGIPGITATGVPFYAYNIWGTKTRFYDKVNVSYYLTDNLKVSAGELYTGGKVMATLGAEYMLPLAPGMSGSLFIDGHVGARNTAGVRGGLKIYFGRSDKTLIRRHREDDPPINLPMDLLTISNSAQSGIYALPVPQVCKDFEGNIIPCGK